MKRLALLCALILCIAATFGGVTQNRFVAWDDDVNLYENPRLNPPKADTLRAFWAAPFQNLYIPATYSAWTSVAKRAFRPAPPPGEPNLDARPFHQLNLGVHILTALLVFALLRAILEKSGFQNADFAAFCGALLWAINPLQTEAVAWATGFKDVLGGFFSVLSLWLYFQFAARPSRARWAFYAAAFLALAAAILSKPSAVTLPLAAAALDFWVVRRAPKTIFASITPWLVLAAGATILTTWSQPLDAQMSVAPLWMRPVVALDAVGFYLQKFAFPVALCPDYGRTPQTLALNFSTLGAVFLALGALVFVFRFQKQPLLGLGAAFFGAALLPVLGLVPFRFQLYSTVADRYAYLALLGPSLLLAAGLARPQTPRWAAPLGALFLLLCAVFSQRQSQIWRDSESLFAHTIASNPASWIARSNWGALLAAQGKTAKALPLLEQSVALNPRFAAARSNFGSALAAQNRPDAAQTQLRAALLLDPTLHDARFNLGLILAQSGDFAGAARELEIVVGAQPENTETRDRLAIALSQSGQNERAFSQWREATRQRPDFAAAHFNWGVALYSPNKPAAIAQWKIAAKLGYEPAREALKKVGAVG